MKFLLLFYFVFAAKASSDETQPSVEQKNNADGIQEKTKRNSLQYEAMISCRTKRNPVEYDGYGCYCGLGCDIKGKGKPVDAIDRCCFVRGNCYKKIIKKKLCGKYSKFAVFTTLYHRRNCSGCASRPLNSACQSAVCKCDGAAARCFKKNDSKFKNKNKNYKKSSCSKKS